MFVSCTLDGTALTVPLPTVRHQGDHPALRSIHKPSLATDQCINCIVMSAVITWALYRYEAVQQLGSSTYPLSHLAVLPAGDSLPRGVATYSGSPFRR